MFIPTFNGLFLELKMTCPYCGEHEVVCDCDIKNESYESWLIPEDDELESSVNYFMTLEMNGCENG